MPTKAAPGRLRAFRACALLAPVLIVLIASPAHGDERPLLPLLQQRAHDLELSRAPTWSALLHVSEGHPNIRDPAFLLSAAGFSLEQELAQTLDYLYGQDRRNVCRFPARYLWLRQRLDSPSLPIEECADIVDFRQKAPADRIFLSFASESLAQPASMMGHVFLKLGGTDHRGQIVEHAVSFFTEAATLNIPKLFFDSVVIGMNGYFSLAPYEEKVSFYVVREQRTLWEYELRFDEFQRELVHNHLIELKQTHLTYFFQKYNCATVIDFILSVGAGSQAAADTRLWVTPKDVIKRALKLDLIRSSTVMSPSRWIMRALTDQLSNADIQRIKASVERLAPLPDVDPQSAEAFVRLEFAMAYHRYRIEKNKLNEAEGEAYADSLRQTAATRFAPLNLEASEYKSPLYTPPDSQLEIGIMGTEDDRYTRFTFTPVSHRLEDDNRQYFSENELVLFELSVLADLRRNQFVLDHLTVYSAQSLFPYDRLSGGISGRFRLGVEPRFDRELQRHRTAFVSGGIGLTLRVATDVDVYSVVGGGLAYGDAHTQVYAEPEVGLIAREIFSMKSLLSVVKSTNLVGDTSSYYTFRAMQSKYFTKQQWSLHLNFAAHIRGQRQVRQVDLSLKKLF